jgi:hypothetical protein
VTLVDEEKQVPVEDVASEHRFHQCAQPVEALAKIDRLGAEIDAAGRRQTQHRGTFASPRAGAALAAAITASITP